MFTYELYFLRDIFCSVCSFVLTSPFNSLLLLANLSDGGWSEGGVQDNPRCIRCTSKRVSCKRDSEAFGMTLPPVSGSSFHPLWVATHAAGGKASYSCYDSFPCFHPERIDTWWLFLLRNDLHLSVCTESSNWDLEKGAISPQSLGGGNIVKQCYLAFSIPSPSFPFPQVTQSMGILL